MYECKHLCFERSVADSAIQSYVFPLDDEKVQGDFCLPGDWVGGGGEVGKRPVDD